MQATKGRTVLYKLSAADALRISKSRAFGGVEGNSVGEGDVYPATVVEDGGGSDAVNLKVHLDGNDDFWATSRTKGDGPGHWVWPPIKTAKRGTPKVGDTVHYASHGTPVLEDGTQAYETKCRAAIITEVMTNEDLGFVGDVSRMSAEDLESLPVFPIGLCVLNPSGTFFNEAEYDEDAMRGGTWHHADHA